MTPIREQSYRLARLRLAQSRRATQLLMDVQGDDLAAALLREKFRHLRNALDDFARYQCGVKTPGREEQ